MIYYIKIWHVLSIYVWLNIYIWSIWLEMVLELNQSSSWGCRLRALGDEVRGRCSVIIHSSPPLPFSLEGGSRQRAYGDPGIPDIDLAIGNICYGDPGDNRHHLIVRNIHSIFPSCWSHSLLPSFYRSTQFVWSLMAGYCFIFFQPLRMLVNEDLLFLTNSLRTP